MNLELSSFLKNIKDSVLKHEFAEIGTLKTFKKGETIVQDGSYIKSIPIILRGSLAETSVALHLLKIVVLALFAGGYFYVTDQLIMPLEKKRIALFGFSAIGILLLSWATILFIKGYGTNTSFLNAFKMGYPYFWAAIILGFVGIFLVESHNEQ